MGGMVDLVDNIGLQLESTQLEQMKTNRSELYNNWLGL